MAVTILDKYDKDDRYVILQDMKFLYIASEHVSERIKNAMPTGAERMSLADIIIELDTGAVVKSRYTPIG